MIQLKLQGVSKGTLLMVIYIKKKPAIKAYTWNVSPCTEEAEASSDGLILSNICKSKMK